ncbi:glycerophosphodiester phosphodiesterase domain-containing protein 4 isoform X2 [Balaenoptera ricei]|nr:glycerophosphodiester phosphodiesterase domain-containing protein 4 isoform X2 [Balaenoptera ricei]XP_059786717.1 glycerophosphodiester phosphodiesterase domain-containing protein 4 isoform X2 [Balaenoptera ricei]XP_059786719.1 glycerophosphodiester phosphodiesterase domain-containing protein 4 isoform X2 [Balaenoptera ricei]
MPMKANRIEPRSQKTERWKKDSPWILHIFNHKCCVTSITGCYSCQWKIKQEKKSKRGPYCSWRERLFYACLVISFCVSVLLLFVWIESSNEYFGFDWVIFLGTGFWFFWSIVLLSFFGILAAYTSLLLVLGSLLLWEGIELYLHWCHKILILLVILTCSFFFWILFTYWKDRWLTVGLSLQVFAPYIHLSSISVMVMLSWPVAFYLIYLEGEALQVAIGVPFFLILLCLYLLPLGIYSPCIQEKDKLGPKPNFFGHRGAPMLGPENTMMAFEKAVEHGAFGLESDVQMSYDHVPFLMHDSDLRRTTNINEVLPNASLTHPSLFDWDFLSTLNAGKWFSHPRIFWVPGFDREYVRKRAPGFQQVGQLFSIERLRKENISRINVDYKRLFYSGLREYKAVNININLYIVNEPWLFSLAWCSSIYSVTTDNIQVLNEINHPYFFMTPSYYKFMWILMDCVSAVFIVAVFYFHWWRESQKEKLLKSTGIHTESQSISLRTGKSENQEPSHISIDPPARVMEIPWIQATLYPTLTKSVRKHPDPSCFSVVPMKKASKPEQVSKTIKTPMPGKDDVRQLVPTMKAFEPTQAPIWESTRETPLQTSLSAIEADETISCVDIPHPEKQIEKPPSIESSEESSFMFSTTSSLSFSSLRLSSKKD